MRLGERDVGRAGAVRAGDQWGRRLLLGRQLYLLGGPQLFLLTGRLLGRCGLGEVQAAGLEAAPCAVGLVGPQYLCLGFLLVQLLR